MKSGFPHNSRDIVSFRYQFDDVIFFNNLDLLECDAQSLLTAEETIWLKKIFV
jgi:hypothetical protein